MKKKVLLGMMFLIQTTFGQQYTIEYEDYFGNKSHTEGISILETAENNLFISSGFYKGEIPYSPELYYKNNNDDVVLFSSEIGNGPLVLLNDGSYVNSHINNDEILIIKFKNNGEIIWNKKYHFGYRYNQVSDIVQLKNGNILISCFYAINDNYFPPYNSSIIMLNNNGEHIGIKCYGNETNTLEIQSVVETNNGELGILFYQPWDSTGYNTYMLYKTDNEGNKIWEYKVIEKSGVSGYCDLTYVENKNQFIVVGSLYDGGFISKIDNNGDNILYKYYPISTVGWVPIKNIICIKNNRYIFASEKIFVIDGEGNILWSSKEFNVVFNDIIEMKNGCISLIGYSLTKIEQIALIEIKQEYILNNVIDNDSIGVFPNPVVDISILNISDDSKVYVYNIEGKLIKQYFNSNIKIHQTDYNAGIYIYQVVKNNIITKTGKFFVK